MRLRRFVLAVIFAIISVAATFAGPPNIVFVLFDDLGWSQPGCYAPDSKLQTPQLDRLASQGMRFTDAHSASAVCTPTRYGVLTGRYPWRIGQFGVLTTYSSPIIPANRPTVASLLKQQGYATACIGKWHLGLDWVDANNKTKDPAIGARFDAGPNRLGFDYFCGFTHARNIQSILEQDRVVERVEPKENQPLMIAKTLAWLRERKVGEPFFLYFPMCPPHTPIEPSDEYLGKSGAVDVVRKVAKYGDWVYQGDAMLGQIMQTLDELGMADNTLLIATSDNGAEHRAYEPLRASKQSIYEGGHRVPMIARWPGHVEAGSVCDRTVCLNDLLATAADLTGAKVPENAGEDSFSLVPALLGKTTERVRPATVHQSNVGDLAIRRDRWKLVLHKNGKRELFDLDNDLSEQTDRLADEPQIAEELTAEMQQAIDRGRTTPGTSQPVPYKLWWSAK